MTARVRVLLTGATGYLGRHVRALADPARIDLVVASRGGGGLHLDLADAAAVATALATARPDVVLHLGALSSIAACERDPDLAAQVNGRATAALCAQAARVVYVSTDLVFGGDRAPYAVGDATRPLSVYGRTKVMGEEAVLASGRGVVVRLPLLFGPSFDGRRGATDMIRAAAAEGRALTLFTDEFRTPLHVADAARLLLECVLAPPPHGTLHVAGSERISRFALGERFVARTGVEGARLLAAPSDDPRRPKDVSLRGDWHPPRDLDAALAAS